MKLERQQLIDLVVQAARLPYVNDALVIFEGNLPGILELMKEVGETLAKKGMMVKIHNQRLYLQVIGGPRIQFESSAYGLNLDHIRGRMYQHIIIDEPMVFDTKDYGEEMATIISRLR
jgi:hypothetical protein